MRIEQELKLDFKDVLIRPKRSTLTSRSEVDISREFVFPHSKRSYQGIPIIAANMDATGTMEMARALAKQRLSVALHKHYSEAELLDFFATQPESPPTFYSMGITTPDLEKFRRVHDKANGSIQNVCVDVANGYTSAFVRFIEADAELLDALKARQWPEFARIYNGPAYREGLYDVKLDRAYDRYVALDPAAPATVAAISRRRSVFSCAGRCWLSRVRARSASCCQRVIGMVTPSRRFTGRQIRVSGSAM